MAVGQLNTFLDRLLQYVPEEKKAEARSIYSSAADRASELERSAAVVTETGQKQREWWDRNKDAVADRDRLAAELAAKGTSTVDQNTIQKAIDEANARTMETGLGLVVAVSDIVAGHIIEFGERIDTTKLAKEAIAAGTPIDQFYNQQMATRRQERADAALNERLANARKEGEESGRKAILDSMGQSLPFPSPSGQPAITTLSGLRRPAEGAANPFSLDAAVATAMEVASKQG